MFVFQASALVGYPVQPQVYYGWKGYGCEQKSEDYGYYCEGVLYERIHCLFSFLKVLGAMDLPQLLYCVCYLLGGFFFLLQGIVFFLLCEQSVFEVQASCDYCVGESTLCFAVDVFLYAFCFIGDCRA